jgi:RNA polymerase sigma-70 factor (ECF subfamily)
MSEPFALTPEALLQHREFLRGLARGLLADDAGVDDVLQEAYVRALERPPRSEDALRSWLARVVRNLALNRLRGERRRASRERDVAQQESVPSSADVADRLGTQRRVVDAVRELSEPYRTVIYLRWYEGLPPRTIAQRLERPIETVRSQLKRGHALLRDELDAEFGGGTDGRAVWAGALLPFAGPPALPLGAIEAAGASTPWVPVIALAAVTVVVGGIAFLAFGTGSDTDSATSAPALSSRGAAELDGGALGTPLSSERRPRSPAASTSSTVSIGAVQAVPVRGRALRVSGEPIPALTVWIDKDGQRVDAVETDAAGFFRSTNEVNAGRVTLTFADGPFRNEDPMILAETTLLHVADPRRPATDHTIPIGPTYRLDLFLPPGLATTDLMAVLEDPGTGSGDRVLTGVRPGPIPWVRFYRTPHASLMDTGGHSMYALSLVSLDGNWGSVNRVHAQNGVYEDILRVTLRPRGSVRIVARDGRGVLDALELELVSAEHKSLRLRTNERGRVTFVPLAPGSYTLRTRAGWVDPVEQSVEVRAGEVTDIELDLIARESAPLQFAFRGASGQPVLQGRYSIRSIDHPDDVFFGEIEGAGRGPVQQAAAVRHLPVGEYIVKPPVVDGFPWEPRSQRVQVPGPEVTFVYRDDGPMRGLVLRVFDDVTGKPIDTFRAVVLIDRYRLGIRRAAAFEPELRPRYARFDEPVARVPDDLPLAWVVEAEGYRSVQGNRDDLVLEGGRLVANVRLPLSWKTRLWIGTRDDTGRAVPLPGVCVRTSGGKLLGTSLGDGEVRLELLYDPGRLVVEHEGWSVASWEGYLLGRRRVELDPHRVWLEREDS